MSYSFAKLYATEDMLDTSTTGLIDINMIILSKTSETVRADLQQKSSIYQHFM